MLQIKNLDINLIKDDRKLFENFDLALNPGDKVGLIGEEGNGKSILLKALVDKLELSKYCQIRGEIHKKDEIIGYLPQSLDEKYLDMEVASYMGRIIDLNLLDYNKFYRYLDKFELGEDLIFGNMKLRDLSGGERVKIILFF